MNSVLHSKWNVRSHSDESELRKYARASKCLRGRCLNNAQNT